LTTSNKVTVMVWALETPARFTVTEFVPLPLVLETLPVPVVTAALEKVT